MKIFKAITQSLKEIKELLNEINNSISHIEINHNSICWLVMEQDNKIKKLKEENKKLKKEVKNESNN